MNDDWITGLAVGFLVGVFLLAPDLPSKQSRPQRVAVYDTPPLMTDEDWEALYQMLDEGEG